MPRILIIEDEPDIARLMAKKLMTNGFEVFIAIDAYQGVKSAHQNKPDLIILDLMLPAGGGVSVFKNIRASTETCTIPVIVVSGMGDAECKNRLLREGVEGYFEKPYDGNALVAAIRNVLSG